LCFDADATARRPGAAIPQFRLVPLLIAQQIAYHNSMKFRTWPLLCAGFGALLVLIVLSAVVLRDRMEEVYSEVATIQETERESREIRDRLRSELYLVSIFVRDYLLEASSKAAANEREALEELRTSMLRNLALLEQAARSQNMQVPESLHKGVVDYWRSIDAVFEWTPAERTAKGSSFLRKSLVPHRDAVLAAASQVGALSASEATRRREQILRTEQKLKGDLRLILLVTFLVGVAVAAVSIARTRWLEANASAYLRQIEHNAAELRKLSQKLAAAQEDERRSISRELHDQVGQMLTALRMELGNLQDFREAPREFEEHMTEARNLTEETLRTVRTMSMGLRPSVLDELGLAPALTWQAREFTRRSGVPVDVSIDGEFDRVPDSLRTCVYRVVQEALTNCARHANAKRIRIRLEGGSSAICLKVEDDGVGFNFEQSRGEGLGLLGMEERVKELGGSMRVESRRFAGTTLHCEFPAASGVAV
jgi:signal transduction histidine kinase